VNLDKKETQRSFRMKLNLEMFNKKKQSLISRREEMTSVVNRYVQSETTGPTVRESNRD
jgi:hypothetical protein